MKQATILGTICAALLLMSPIAKADAPLSRTELVVVSPDELVEIYIDGVLKGKGQLLSVPTAPGKIAIELRGSTTLKETIVLERGQRAMVVFTPNSHRGGAFDQVLVAGGPELPTKGAAPFAPPAASPKSKATKKRAVLDGNCGRASHCGSIEIRSPNVFGQVTINGVELGYPPLVIKNIEAGYATVEVKVQGVVRRAKNIEVQRGHRTKVVLLSKTRALIKGPKKTARRVSLERVRTAAR